MEKAVFVFAGGLRLAMLVYGLRSRGHRIDGQHTASDAKAAMFRLDLCGEEVKVAVLTDSPGMVGKEAESAKQVAEYIKKNHPHIVIVEAGSVSRGISEHFVGGNGMGELSVDDVVSKVREVCENNLKPTTQ